jgi:hypothetical protein
MFGTRKNDDGGAGLVIAIVLGVIAILILPAVIWFIGVATSDVAGKGNAIKKKNAAVNRISAQEAFEQSYADIKAADRKVAVAKEALDLDPTDPTLRTNYTGVKQFCIGAVEDYNADARKYTREDFRAVDLPAQIETDPDLADPATDCK